MDVQLKARTDATGRQIKSPGVENRETVELHKLLLLRRRLQILQKSKTFIELNNEIYHLEWIERQLSKKKQRRVSALDGQRLAELAHLKKIQEELQSLLDAVITLEDASLIPFYQQEDAKINAEEFRRISLRWPVLLKKLYLRQFDNPNEVTVAIFGSPSERLLELTMAYIQVVRHLNGKLQLWEFLPGDKGREKGTRLIRREVLDHAESILQRQYKVQEWIEYTEQFLSSDCQEHVITQGVEGVIGFGLRIKADAALPLFQTEAGVHHFNAGQNAGRCLVDVTETPVYDAKAGQYYKPPEGIERKGGISTEPRCRLYFPDRGEVENYFRNRKFVMGYDPDELVTFLQKRMEEQLGFNAESILHS